VALETKTGLGGGNAVCEVGEGTAADAALRLSGIDDDDLDYLTL
jgi:hypothetical protein